MKYGGNLTFSLLEGECFVQPKSAFLALFIIPFSLLLIFCCVITTKVYFVFRDLAANLGNIEYKSLFSYPAVLVLLNVPISIDYMLRGIGDSWFPLMVFC